MTTVRGGLRSGVVIALIIGAPLEAQRVADASVGARVEADRASTASSLMTGLAQEPQDRGNPSWWTPLASAVLPGSGQALLDQDRFVVYAAVEGIALLRYTAARREGSRQRRAYRDLANRVARAFFTTNPQAGTFDYYERMQHYVESGVFDVDPATPTLEPEVDTLTFNGSLWLLARRTFWEHPDAPPPPESEAFARATEFYLERAIRPDFRWSWRNAQLEHDVYRRTIGESNEAYRQAIQALGVVLANHVLSTIDAYVTLRLWSRDQTSRSVGVSATVPLGSLARRERTDRPR